MIVTGGASGIGIETARALAERGAEVTIAVRNAEAGAQVAAEIDGDVRVAPLELTDLNSVRQFVDAWAGPLDVLVNNAGVMAIQERELTETGSRCSSQPTTSAISPSPSASMTRSRPPAPHA